LRIDGRVVVFALALSVVTAFLFGLAPAIAGHTGGHSRHSARQRGNVEPGTGPAAGPQSSGRRTNWRCHSRSSPAQDRSSRARCGSAISNPGFQQGRDSGGDRWRSPGRRMRSPSSAWRSSMTRHAVCDRCGGVASVRAVSHLPLIDRDVPYAVFALEDAAPTERTLTGSVRFADAGYFAAMRIPRPPGPRLHRSRGARSAGPRHPHQRHDGQALLARPRSDRHAAAVDRKRRELRAVHDRRRRGRGQPTPTPRVAGEPDVRTSGGPHGRCP